MGLDEMVVREINVNSIITESNLPGTDYVINPYVGCQHACVYCYAEFMKRFTDHHEEWGDFVDIKINALEVLGNIKKYRNKRILLSSVTDPYHPVEAKYKLTRRILEALIPAQPRIGILTKGRMVVRDIDLLQQYNHVSVGVSIATLDNEYSRELEPVAALPHLRIDVIKKCKEAGLPTYVFLSPIFPYITEIEKIMELSVPYVDFFMFENLNLRPTNLYKIKGFLEKFRPDLIQSYNEIYNSNEQSHQYWQEVKDKIELLCKGYGKEAKIYFHHGGFKKQK